MGYAAKYTTETLKAANPTSEKDKAVVSNDTFALLETLQELAFRIGRVK